MRKSSRRSAPAAFEVSAGRWQVALDARRCAPDMRGHKLPRAPGRPPKPQGRAGSVSWLDAVPDSSADMKVCLVTAEYLGISGYVGGLGVRYATLAPALARDGIDMHVLTYGAGLNRTVELDGVRVHAVGRPPVGAQRVWEEVWWDVVADRALRRMPDLDVVYAPEWRGALARYALRRRRGAIVTNLTSSLAQILSASADPPRPALRPPVRWMIQHRLERAQAEGSDGIVAASGAILGWSRSLWQIDDIPSVTLSNQIDLAAILAQIRGPLPEGFPQHGPVVAFSGRLQVLKGVCVLVDAMRRVWSRRPEVHLVMLGGDALRDGTWMSERLRDQAGPHASQLHVLGHQSHERLIPALARADVVALPSLWESFGNAALEAMAVGRPVVVTSGCGYSDFCRHEDNALLVGPKDEAALGDAILRLLEDKALRRRLGEKAAADARQYSADPAARLHREFFDNVLAGR